MEVWSPNHWTAGNVSKERQCVLKTKSFPSHSPPPLRRASLGVFLLLDLLVLSSWKGVWGHAAILTSQESWKVGHSWGTAANFYWDCEETATWWFHNFIFLLQIDGETMETVKDFILGGSKTTADGNCSHEIKRRLLLGRQAMTNLDSILKSRDITLLTKV